MPPKAFTRTDSGLDRLISQPQLRRLFGEISDMTIWRWRQIGLLPQPIVINRRNFYRSSDIAAMQEKLARESGVSEVA